MLILCRNDGLIAAFICLLVWLMEVCFHEKSLLCLALAMLGPFLTSCSAPKEVPEQTIAWVVEDYLQGSGLGAVAESSYEVTHTPDESTKTDTVHIALDAAFERASLSSSYAATYQYNKASDLWTLIRGGQWQTETVDSYRLDYSPAPLLSIMIKQDRYAEIETEPIYIWGSIPETEPVDYWHIDSANNDIYYLETIDADSAYEFFLTICSMLVDLPDGVTEEANAAGENYHYLRYSVSDRDAFLICQDNRILVANGETGVLDEILNAIGLVSDRQDNPFDVETETKQHVYHIGEKYLQEGELDAAIEVFGALGDFNDSAARVEEAIEKKNALKYEKAEKMFENKDYVGAISAFEALGSYKDSAERIDDVKAAAAEVKGVTIDSDDEGTKMSFNSDGTYRFDFESYSIVDEGTYTYEGGVLTVKDVNGVEYTAEGETLHLHYGYSGAPEQLTGEFTIDPVIFSQE